MQMETILCFKSNSLIQSTSACSMLRHSKFEPRKCESCSNTLIPEVFVGREPSI